MLRFGTDGVRGDADADLTSPLIVALGRAVARVLRPDAVVIGRDTRASGERIELDLRRGFAAEGARVRAIGVLPTPAIAFEAERSGEPAAIISASHNRWTDNGVKIIGADGRKLADDAERAIERELNAAIEESSDGWFGDAPIGVEVATPYVEHLLGALAGRQLDGMRVVLDCANGAAFEVGPRALRAAGADVGVIHAEPDGRNINDQCGSTHPASLQRAVVAERAAIGLALDGDADRVIAVDENGAIVDGDQVMTMLALDLHARGVLHNDAIVATVMSNLGLRRALTPHGVHVHETPVGDRHVVAAMQRHDIALGGEQSGHIIFSDYATTGDGLLTGLLVCDLVRRSGRTLSELAQQMTRYPQLLVNVRVAQRVNLEHADALWAEVRAIEAELGNDGRVLVRASGTEPVVRIMAEATTAERAAQACERLRAAVEAEFGL